MELYRTLVHLAETSQPFVFAAVVKTTGSTPQKTGAKALFSPSGECWGTLGGGCLEAEARRRGLEAFDTGKRLLFSLNLDDDHGWDDGLICGGKAHIYVDPHAAANVSAYRAALDALEARGRGALVTRLALEGPGAGEVYWLPESDFKSAPAGLSPERLGGILGTEKPAWIGGGADPESGLFIEPVLPPPRLVIAGGGHVGQATAHMAAMLGFEVVVVDDRPAFTDSALFPPGAQTICGNIAETVGRLAAGADTYLLIVTRGHRNDAGVLAACIHAPVAFIGMIGSKRKISLIRKNFIRDGIATEEDFARVASPVGLEIGAVSVPEIACSICAQLVAVRRRCADMGAPMRLAVYA